MPKPEREFSDAADRPWVQVSGSASAGLDRTFTAGMYACRPPGMKHGPYASPGGALLFETRYRA